MKKVFWIFLIIEIMISSSFQVFASDLEVIVKGKQKAYISGEDWGPVVSKTIISLDSYIDKDSLDINDFIVIEEKDEEVKKRSITHIYASDEKGNTVESNSQYITIEMKVSSLEGLAFYRYPNVDLKDWYHSYQLHIELNKDGEVLNEKGDTVSFQIESHIDLNNDTIIPQLEGFDKSSFHAKDGIDYSYCSYIPTQDDHKNPLIIWLHGGGEGGTNPVIPLLGGKASVFKDDEFQNVFNGAYVLVPQCPTKWMNSINGKIQHGNLGSAYSEGLFELIQDFVDKHSDIDKDRILIGGCSNGGYMTMELILKHPSYFAGAFPICQTYYSQYITDEQIQLIKDIPIWMTYSPNDPHPSAIPSKCSAPIYERLKAAHASYLHSSVFEQVVVDGVKYSQHWVWIYFLRNECIDDENPKLNAWKWLSTIKKDKDIQDISLEESHTIPLNESQKLDCQVSPSYLKEDLKWTSSNTKIATVDNEGNVIAKAVGTADILVESPTQIKKICKVTVNNPIKKVSLNYSKLTLNKGKSKTLKAIIYPSNTTDNKDLNWSTSNKNIVTVTQKGVVKALKAGKATITVKTSTNQIAKCEVTIKEIPLKGISLNYTQITLLKGKSKSLKVSFKPIDTTDNKTISWSTSNKKVVLVNQSGKIKAVNIGTAVITAKAKNGKTVKCKVTVPYTISYYLNGGKNHKSNKKTYYGKKKLKNPNRKGYSFSGWYLDKKFKKKFVQTSKGNIKVYAKWKKITVGKTKTPLLSHKKKGQIKVSYQGVFKANGYQIQYSTNRQFKKAVTKHTTKKSFNISHLKRRKRYYVRIRAYKIDSAKSKVYGKWSYRRSIYIWR